MKKWSVSTVLACIVGISLFASLAYNYFSGDEKGPLSVSEEIALIKEGKVEKITIQVSGGEFYIVTLSMKEDYKNGTTLGGVVSKETYLEFRALATEHSIPLIEEGIPSSSWKSFIIIFLMILLALGASIALGAMVSGGMKGGSGFGRFLHSRWEPEQSNIKFRHVAGIDAAVDKARRALRFLTDRESMARNGAKPISGVLLEGPPGNGKTLLAKAIAGEAGVPFFSISGSEFVEMFVGVGASRMRDLFRQAKQCDGAVIFIDELDAIGKQRGGAGPSGGNDEREQTLNQLLVEMDGFSTADNVLVIAATNRKEVLDPALLRLGRFTYHIHVGQPTMRGRKKILDVTVREQDVPLADDVDLDIVARMTIGFSGADCAGLVNEAAIIATDRGANKVFLVDFESARDEIIMGTATPIEPSDSEKHTVAIHEVGHAFAMRASAVLDPILKVTVKPRGNALGMVVHMADEERYLHPRQFFLDTLAGLLAGRVAEMMFLKDGEKNVTAGAQDDIQRATALAQQMVFEWDLADVNDEVIRAYRVAKHTHHESLNDFELLPLSESGLSKLDEAVDKLLKEAAEQAKATLEKEKPHFMQVVEALLENEELTAKDIDRLAKVEG